MIIFFKELLDVIALSTISGFSIFIGGIVGVIFYHKRKHLLNHFMVALGAGLLISAVGIVLIPLAENKINYFYGAALMILGGILVMAFEQWLYQRNTVFSQYIAMFLDFVPEVIILGSVYSVAPKISFLLAIYICLQNIPEGFNAYIELNDNIKSKKKSLLLLLSGTIIGPLVAGIGFCLLNNNESVVPILALLSSGGIIYLMFQDIAPAIQVKRSCSPAFGAIIGYSLAYIFHGWVLHS
jgi:ZIP family zinc transporter